MDEFFTNVDVDNFSDIIEDFIKSIFDYTSTALTFSTIDRDDSYKRFEITKFKFKNTIDKKIIDICENIYNCDNNQVHRYTFMSTFLISCIELIENILELIERISKRIIENGEFYLNEDFNNKIDQDLIEIFKKFNDECNSIVYFYYDEDGKKLLNELYSLLSDHLKFNYSVKDFDNSEFLYSDIQLTWTIIKFNLKLYEKEKYEQYRNITYIKGKNIEWDIMKPLTDIFYPSSDETIVKTNKSLIMNT